MRRSIAALMLCFAFLLLFLTGCFHFSLQKEKDDFDGYDDVGGIVEPTPTPTTSAEFAPSAAPEETKEQEEQLEDDEIQILERVDTSKYRLVEVSNDNLSVTIPDTWELERKQTEVAMAVLQSWTLNDNRVGNTNNANIQILYPFSGRLDEEIENALVENIQKEDAEGTKILNSDVYEYDGNPVICVEMESYMTEELLDLIIQDGNITQDLIDSYGGREKFIKSIAPTFQVIIYAIVEDTLLAFMGTFNEPNDKTEILDVLKIMLETVKIK